MVSQASLASLANHIYGPYLFSLCILVNISDRKINWTERLMETAQTVQYKIHLFASKCFPYDSKKNVSIK